MMQTYPMAKQRIFRFNRRFHNEIVGGEKKIKRKKRKKANGKPKKHMQTPSKGVSWRKDPNTPTPVPHKGTVYMRRFGRKINHERMKRIKNGPLLNNWQKYPTERWRNDDTP